MAGVRAGALLVRIGAPPVEDAANRALVRLLARLCRVPPRAITIKVGDKGRNKSVHIDGLTAKDVAVRLGLSAEAVCE